MSTVSPAYFEIIEFIAAGTTPEAVVHFRPSSEAQQRVVELIEREREGSLSVDEKAELDHFVELEHILRMAKAKAARFSVVAHEISEHLRVEVARRADRRCEFCLI